MRNSWQLLKIIFLTYVRKSTNTPPSLNGNFCVQDNTLRRRAVVPSSSTELFMRNVCKTIKHWRPMLLVVFLVINDVNNIRVRSLRFAGKHSSDQTCYSTSCFAIDSLKIKIISGLWPCEITTFTTSESAPAYQVHDKYIHN